MGRAKSKSRSAKWHAPPGIFAPRAECQLFCRAIKREPVVFRQKALKASSMAEYLSALQSSTLPLPLPGVVVLWCLLYLLSHALARKQQAVFKSHPQTFIITEEPSRLVREQSWGLVCVQLLLTAGVFASAALGGPPAGAFLAGGGGSLPRPSPFQSRFGEFCFNVRCQGRTLLQAR